jgi:hypothetical protein
VVACSVNGDDGVGSQPGSDKATETLSADPVAGDQEDQAPLKTIAARRLCRNPFSPRYDEAIRASARPRCVAAVPNINRLHDQARAHNTVAW